MLATVFAFAQVVLIDVALSADNALAIGLAVHGLPEEDRKEGMMWGIGCAVVLRVACALLASEAMQYSGLRIVGGAVLGYVAYKMLRELTAEKHGKEHPEEVHEPKTLKTAIWQIVVADIAMSFDNVLAVVGAAGQHPGVMSFGIALSIVLMAYGAHLVERFTNRYWWFGWAALAVIAVTAAHMTWTGLWMKTAWLDNLMRAV